MPSELRTALTGADINEDEKELVLSSLCASYEGYRFSCTKEALYNPYSVLCALDANTIEDFRSGAERILFWAQTGQPAMLIKLMFSHKCNIFDLLYGVRIAADDLMEYRWTEEDLIPLIYQTGYLSIADQESTQLFTLVPPNKEVRTVLCRNLLSFVSSAGQTSKFSSELEAMRESLLLGDTAAFVTRFGQSLKDIALIRQKKESAEYISRLAFHAISNIIGYVVKDSNSDVMLEVSDGKKTEYYVFELKMEKNIALDDIFADAFMRIQEKKYPQRFPPFVLKDSSFTCHQVALVFNSAKGTIAGWKEELFTEISF